MKNLGGYLSIFETAKGLQSLLLRQNVNEGVIERPLSNRNKESSVQGIYVIGDLGDAPVIKSAFNQGSTLGKHLRDTINHNPNLDFDVLIVGAGPAGVAAAVELIGTGLTFEIIDQNFAFSTIDSFLPKKKIYAQPINLETHPLFHFQNAIKEDLVSNWTNTLAENNLRVKSGHKLIGIKKINRQFTVKIQTDTNQNKSVSSQVIVLATGKRGTPNSYPIPGSELGHVLRHLEEPRAYIEKDVVIVGGGDSAAEAAVALADIGARVSMIYRGKQLYRLSLPNKAAIQQRVDDNTIRLCLNTELEKITNSTVFTSSAETLPAEAVFVLIGNQTPVDFLHRLGLKTTVDHSWWRPMWLGLFLALSYCFYVLKKGLDFFPFATNSVLGWLPESLVIESTNHSYNASFWGTLFYSALITIFGLIAYTKQSSRTQKNRYLSLIGFQLVFLFGIPELLSPFIFSLGGAFDSMYFEFLGGMRAWKWYSLSVPWPLNIYALIDSPSWTSTNSFWVPVLWLLSAATVSFVLIPLYVKRHGQRFCSYLCGCGGLAETLGDFWRHLAPKGIIAKKLERMGRWILLLCIPVTLLALVDAWQLIKFGFIGDAAAWSQQWYTLMVDFWFASVLGVGLYPYLGNRVWCRFLCPLRAYMEALSKRFSKLAIESNSDCIGCGECTRHCQMGIQIQRFAQSQLILDNRNSACIQCGVCIDVCPMQVLSIGQAGEPVTVQFKDLLKVPTAPWEMNLQ